MRSGRMRRASINDEDKITRRPNAKQIQEESEGRNSWIDNGLIKSSIFLRIFQEFVKSGEEEVIVSRRFPYKFAG